MLQPKKTKFRKAFKGRIKGETKGGATLNFGSYGLKALEPDFTMDALAHNPAYPVGVLRRAGLLRSDRIRALGEP